MIRTLLLLCLLALTTLHADENSELKKMIGRMLIVGFEGTSVDKDSSIIQDIQNYNLGGVILFDKFYSDINRTKNISSPQQVSALSAQLRSFSKKPLFISIDQEGGKVARLKPKYGFLTIPSAFDVAKLSHQEASALYRKQSAMIKDVGINLNFAPVVDLSVNPKNHVIVGLNRSYGKKSETVSAYAQIMMQAQSKNNIISVLKHFPGHGSSLGDSHKGFVDVSKTWTKEELEPYRTLIKTGKVQMIMTAHVFNSQLDGTFPATLSHKVNTDLLRGELGYTGVIISDDLQMRAISKHYTLERTVTLAINAGVDILLFGNQLAYTKTSEIVETILKGVQNGTIDKKRIIESNQRIERLHRYNTEESH